MSNFQVGDKIRVRPLHPSVRFRGDTGKVEECLPLEKYKVSLEENGFAMVEENQIEDIKAIEWRSRL